MNARAFEQAIRGRGGEGGPPGRDGSGYQRVRYHASRFLLHSNGGSDVVDPAERVQTTAQFVTTRSPSGRTWRNEITKRGSFGGWGGGCRTSGAREVRGPKTIANASPWRLVRYKENAGIWAGSTTEEESNKRVFNVHVHESSNVHHLGAYFPAG